MCTEIINLLLWKPNPCVKQIVRGWGYNYKLQIANYINLKFEICNL